ncbi:MAG: hypothetical protein M1827_002233 [Pycnora praestabilis]|nr:MAG: hypothetical protein M1827_002233 [Pycnora praestabilis]
MGPSQDLYGKIAVITGVTRGIGRGIAIQLASRGCSILGTYSSGSSAHHFDTLRDEVQQACKDNGDAEVPMMHGVAANMLDDDCASTIVAEVKHLNWSHVNILVNNAACAEMSFLVDIDKAHIHRVMTGNVQTPTLLVQALLPYFQPNSRIINISSVSTRISSQNALTMVYGASKAAMEALTIRWADCLGKRKGMEGTTANAVSVGPTNTELWTQNTPEEYRARIKEDIMSKTAVGHRIGEVDDIVEIVGFLAGDGSRWVSGSVVSANGGYAKIS